MINKRKETYHKGRQKGKVKLFIFVKEMENETHFTHRILLIQIGRIDAAMRRQLLQMKYFCWSKAEEGVRCVSYPYSDCLLVSVVSVVLFVCFLFFVFVLFFCFLFFFCSGCFSFFFWLVYNGEKYCSLFSSFFLLLLIFPPSFFSPFAEKTGEANAHTHDSLCSQSPPRLNRGLCSPTS